MSIIFSLDLEVVYCANCGVPFGITKDYQERRREDHSGFFCPAGHSNVYHQKTVAEQLRSTLKIREEQLAAETERRRKAEQQVVAEQFKTRAERAAKTKLRRRIAHGVCPCCQRTFKQLAAHMKAKHPNYDYTTPVK